jgi:mono/diheme cytochrome c family protein
MKKRSLFLILVLFTLAITSCKYNFIVPIEEEVPVDTIPGDQPVLYSTQIQPIFTAKCISCHKSGGTAPNLTAGSSYNQVVPAHVNLTKPEESDIYAYPAPSTTKHAWKKYNSTEANLVLTWIKEGAKNN